jgi:phosphoglycerate kinase
MAKLTVQDLDLHGKRVFVRVDYNVPMEEKEGRMVINDLTRIEATLPTLELLMARGARIILAAHLGRPKGKVEPSMSLRPVAAALADMLGRTVAFVDDCVGAKAEQTAGALQDGDLLLLENVRFHPEEETNDPDFAGKLAALADVYVNDAFGAAHRAHASTEGIARVIAARGGVCAAGLLMRKELQFLGDELESPARPFVVILGGAKVSDKIKVIDRLLDKADILLVGGAMTYTFSLAKGRQVGRSLVEPDRVDMARAALEKAASRGVGFLLPTDHVVATPEKSERLDKKGKPVIEWREPRTVEGEDVPENEAGLDIGPKTVRDYAAAIAGAKTILWNGPMGMFEDKRFAEGTFAIARAVAEATRERQAKSLIGGGDSVKALNQSGLAGQVTFVSTGGGASLEFLEGRELPGVAVLTDRRD